MGEARRVSSVACRHLSCSLRLVSLLSRDLSRPERRRLHHSGDDERGSNHRRDSHRGTRVSA